MTCALFGHRDTPQSVEESLRHGIRNLILNRKVDTFYVGQQGSFDRMAISVLRKMQKEYPAIRYALVLAYLPIEKTGSDLWEEENTMFPEGLETVPRRFAISWRNKWMVRHSDIILCYITHSGGGAAQAVQYAKRLDKQICFIN